MSALVAEVCPSFIIAAEIAKQEDEEQLRLIEEEQESERRRRDAKRQKLQHG